MLTIPLLSRALLALGGITLLVGQSGCSKGACESLPKSGAGQEFCLDDSKRSSCEKPSALANHVFHAGKKCSEIGYKPCVLPKVMFKTCGTDRGACVGKVKPSGPSVAPGMPTTFCLENQLRRDCERPSRMFDYTFSAKPCAEVGFPKACVGGRFPASARFVECPRGLTEKK
jgi:hypothetical protein